MTTTRPTNITPADIELVPVADITVGDVLFDRDPSATHPTQRVLDRLANERFYTVTDVNDRMVSNRTHGRVAQRVFNADNGATWSMPVTRWYDPTQSPARMWRVKR
jgi:hypothetical protein